MLDIKKLQLGRLSDIIKDYRIIDNRRDAEIESVKGFRCDIADFDVYSLTLVNGFYVGGDERGIPNGVVVCGLREGLDKYSNARQYIGSAVEDRDNLFMLNNADSFSDGVFIYIGDNVKVDKPIQIINLISHRDSIFVHSRILIVAGSNASAKFIQCSDSPNGQSAFENSVTEFMLGQGASVEYYRTQNVTDDTALVSSIFVKQDRDSRFDANLISLNGGFIKNNTVVNLNGEMAVANINGLYLTDKGQHIDNHVRVNHNVGKCNSSQSFRGILDDYATGAFTGYIKVEKDAQMTEAYQRNNNLLLTDKAKFDTSPFLEIHADNVKCSHGATVGQLDENAMFYLRSRGIGEDKARVLLMNAFAQEIIRNISIEQFKIQLDDMVTRRLRGELSPCEYCNCNCGKTERNCI